MCFVNDFWLRPGHALGGRLLRDAGEDHGGASPGHLVDFFFAFWHLVAFCLFWVGGVLLAAFVICSGVGGVCVFGGGVSLLFLAPCIFLYCMQGRETWSIDPQPLAPSIPCLGVSKPEEIINKRGHLK